VEGIKRNLPREFTEQGLETIQDSMLRNHSTKSIILAPFNSSVSHLDNAHVEELKELAKNLDIISYGFMCREPNRKYEENNNQDIDNGVYNEF
jgi:hypothetical protein